MPWCPNLQRVGHRPDPSVDAGRSVVRQLPLIWGPDARDSTASPTGPRGGLPDRRAFIKADPPSQPFISPLPTQTQSVQMGPLCGPTRPVSVFKKSLWSFQTKGRIAIRTTQVPRPWIHFFRAPNCFFLHMINLAGQTRAAPRHRAAGMSWCCSRERLRVWADEMAIHPKPANTGVFSFQIQPEMPRHSSCTFRRCLAVLCWT